MCRVFDRAAGGTSVHGRVGAADGYEVSDAILQESSSESDVRFRVLVSSTHRQPLSARGLHTMKVFAALLLLATSDAAQTSANGLLEESEPPGANYDKAEF